MQATIVRNPNLEPISYDQLRHSAPAIFSKEAHGDVSTRYGFIPTYSILEAMRAARFVPVEVRNFARKDPKDLQFTQHLIRFRREGKLAAHMVGDVLPQVVLLNSHDRSSRFRLYGGMYRLVCANGLLVSTSDTVRPYVVRHTKGVVEEVVEVSKRLIQEHSLVEKYINVMRKIELTPKEQLQFARDALKLRPARPGQLDPDALLTARREEDNKPTLWLTFNRVQENLTKGGLVGTTANGRRVVTSEIRSIRPDVHINAGVWHLAMAAIRKAQDASKPKATK
jgi:hypothetical protein